MNLEFISEFNNWIGEHIVRRSFWVKVGLGLVASVIIAGVAVYFWPEQSRADSAGPRFATASGDCVNDTSAVGTISWTNPGNAFSDNATNATVALDGATSEYLKCTNFGFTSGMIPSGATINGIVVTIERSVDSSANLRDAAVRIVKGGVIGSTDKSTATAYTTSMVAESHGGASDLWGETWSPSDITASNFGVAYSALNSSSAGGAETVSVDYISITVYYEFIISFDQSSYRWFVNTDSADVGSQLAAQDTTATLSSSGQALRLRTSIHVSDNSLSASGQTFKLQYAGKGSGSCSAPSGTPSTYTDVTAATTIAYNNNATPSDGVALTDNANDPVHSGHTVVNQSYEELNNFTNTQTINVGQDGLWDFALIDNGAPAGTPYCLRIVKSDGSVLDTYSAYPEITTALPPLEQAGYRWFEDVDSSGSTPNGGPTNISDASDFDSTGPPFLDYTRNIVRTSSGTLYAFLVDAQECEIWKSTNGTSWTEQDTSNNPACGVSSLNGYFTTMAVDSNDLLHLLYILNDSTDTLYYSTFNTTTDTFGSQESLTSGSDSFEAGEIVVDSNNKPHVVGFNDSFPIAVDYYNKVSGSWSKISDVSIDMFVAWDTHIVINEDNIPEIMVYDASWDIEVLVGNANNATSFSAHLLESTLGNTGSDFGSMAIDSFGNTWVAYRDENGVSDYISLVKHNDADGWSTWQAPVTNSNTGSDPSIAINGSDVYVFYEDENNDIVYDKYDGNSWSGETVLQTGTYERVKVKWSNYYNNGDDAQIDYLYTDSTDIFWASVGMGPSPTDVGAALAAQDASYTMTAANESVRLRALVGVSTNNLPAGGGDFKLQYVDKGSGTCSAPSGGTPASYTDVTTSTAIAYRDQATAADDASLTANVNDPVRGGVDVVTQSYNELNPLTNTNTVPAGDDGLWDMALIDNGAPAGTTYCLRIIREDGVLLDTYSQYPQLTTFGSGGGITFIKQTTGTSTIAATSESFPATSTSGNTLVLMTSIAAGSTVRLTGVSDSAGNTWVIPGAGQNQNPPSNYVTGSNSYFAMAYALNATAISNITLTISAVDDFGFNLSEFSGIATASAVDQSASSGNAAALTHATPTINTTNTDNLIIGGITVPTATRTLASAGFTALTDWSTSSANGKGAGAYQIVSSTGGYDIDWNISSSQAAGAGIMAFMAAGVGPTPTPTPSMNQRLQGGNWWLDGVRQFLHLD